jgi:hypothetical protein
MMALSLNPNALESPLLDLRRLRVLRRDRICSVSSCMCSTTQDDHKDLATIGNILSPLFKKGSVKGYVDGRFCIR